MTIHSKEEEAGILYKEGLDAVRTGGHELNMLAGHLVLMINGTHEFKGPLWPVRLVLPEKKRVQLTSFVDYLRKPVRDGLGLPSLHFLRQVLRASKEGVKAEQLVRAELAKNGIDFDAIADSERDKAISKAKPQGGDRRSKKAINQGANGPLKTDRFGSGPNTVDRTLGRLKRDYPELAAKVVAGELSANAAAIAAGFRKKPTPFEQVMKLLPKLTAAERRKVNAASR